MSFVDGHRKYKAEWTLHLPALRWYMAWTNSSHGDYNTLTERESKRDVTTVCCLSHIYRKVFVLAHSIHMCVNCVRKIL